MEQKYQVQNKEFYQPVEGDHKEVELTCFKLFINRDNWQHQPEHFSLPSYVISSGRWTKIFWTGHLCTCIIWTILNASKNKSLGVTKGWNIHFNRTSVTHYLILSSCERFSVQMKATWISSLCTASSTEIWVTSWCWSNFLLFQNQIIFQADGQVFPRMSLQQ